MMIDVWCQEVIMTKLRMIKTDPLRHGVEPFLPNLVVVPLTMIKTLLGDGQC